MNKLFNLTNYYYRNSKTLHMLHLGLSLGYGVVFAMDRTSILDYKAKKAVDDAVEKYNNYVTFVKNGVTNQV